MNPGTTAVSVATERAEFIVGHRNRLVGLGLCQLLGGGERAVLAADVEQVLAHARDAQPGAVVVCEDALHPEGASAYLVDALQQQGLDVPVVALVAPDAVAESPWGFARAAVSAGDDGTEVERAVKIAALGATYVDPVLARAWAEFSRRGGESPLTSREMDVLQGLGAGLQNKEIAAKLQISVETVKSHVSNIMSRLGETTRAGVVAAGYRHGLLGADAGDRMSLVASGHDGAGREHPYCADFLQASSLVLRRISQEVDMGLWMVTEVSGERWIVLHTVGQFEGVRGGDVKHWSDSLCSRMVEGEGPRVAAEAIRVAAYANAPIARQLGIKSYVGAPIRRGDGTLFGTICGIGGEPRDESLAEHLPTVERFARLLGRMVPA